MPFIERDDNDAMAADGPCCYGNHTSGGLSHEPGCPNWGAA